MKPVTFGLTLVGMVPDVKPSAALPDGWSALAGRSITLLRETQDEGGGWPASPTFPPYAFCWFRDGSFVAEGASASGLLPEADRFHAWCSDVLKRERPAVDAVVDAVVDGGTAGAELADSDYLPARYAIDGTRHVDDWWNFQVDGYGTWLWALERHLGRSGGRVAPYADAVETATRYLVATGRGTCRDWWEEHRDQHHVTTLAGVSAGLLAAVRMGSLDHQLADRATEVAAEARADIIGSGVHNGHLVKWLGGDEIDASLLAVAALYDVLSLDDALVVATVDHVEALLTDGGVHRYPTDTFYGGGQWPVLACLLAWHHARAGSLTRAHELLDWVAGTADADLLLPEQVAPRLAPDRLAEWDERWGPSAHPLVWSHGMFLGALALLR